MIKTLILTLMVLSIPCHAIVTRHDIASERYLAEPSDFKPLATFYIDGAHGTLIKPQWVITAAHATFCLGAGKNISINKKLHQVEQVFIHNKYAPGQSHDIALVKLTTPVNDIRPATPYKQTNENNQSIWFIGIGGTGNGLTGQTIDNFENKGILRKAQNKVEQAIGPLLKFKFDKGDTALPLEGVSGGGDSGGPAYLIDEHGELHILGISSRFKGSAIGKYGITEIYTRVSYFHQWINYIINGDTKERNQISTTILSHLPAGLTTALLPTVCKDINLKP
ncbi:trypsin-like serine protease [Pseudoalteromonas sp. A25]|uniref:trypsin-like serine protease n=1 Tax=Pseudoalteromonas sp. A25 TaxID=116092 RepID=UPI001260AAC0|nr:trypsin-like serine protease [Pseudoalteromonas sp. A25]